MGKQLKSVDILNEIDEEEKQKADGKSEAVNTVRTAKPIAAPKSNDDGTGEEIKQLKQQAQTAAKGKPSPYQAELREKLRDKVQINFNEVPRFVAEAFDELRTKAGMNKREFLYHLLREKGADIPPYEQMDGRKL